MRIKHITAHAYKRMRERCGWSSGKATKMMKVIREEGKDTSEVAGEMGSWAQWAVHKYGSKYSGILYRGRLFIICKATMITVYIVPLKYSMQKAA